MATITNRAVAGNLLSIARPNGNVETVSSLKPDFSGRSDFCGRRISSFVGHTARSSGRRREDGAFRVDPRASAPDLWEMFQKKSLAGEEVFKTEEGKQKLFAGEAKPKAAAKKKGNGAATGPAIDGLVGGEDAFEKELSGLTGGFPGGEKGLGAFLKSNPPPPKLKLSKELELVKETMFGSPGARPAARPPPLLMPGMTVICSAPDNPYHNFTGIVQRVTDGRVGVLFEGGNWDKLVTFDLADLTRTPKGPPMSNPKSAILETLLEPPK
eukprot:TRINITY_DN20954_c0_g1_i1.p1 TRINITY_DN20954_c0_g1~~TRINITY_DN20954_c0_g1_i1.p1  ORF type:complete len:289 (+),score=66.65 TRINITY_DN20954_c0_g1_i1:62-868(+)